MEIPPDFDAREVARTVALAVSNLHNKNLSSDSCNDETPLVSDRLNAMDVPSLSTKSNDREDLLERKSRLKRFQEWVPTRYVLTFMGFLGFCNVYALRVNLSVALVAMVNSSVYTSSNLTSEECGSNGTNTPSSTQQEGEFLWSSQTQANILGSFFYGYVLTQIPGGRIAELFGGKWLFGIGVLCTAVLTLLTPVVARWGVVPLIALRVAEGLGEGVTFPAMHAMLGRWVPKYERSMLSTIIYSGAQIGTVVAMPISGLLCYTSYGWPSVFYVFGCLGCLWFVFWTWLIHETPESHPRISRKELLYINSGVNEELQMKEKPPIPWFSIWTSVPVWALIITHFGQNWGFYTLLTELPTYFSRILHFDIKSNGLYSSLPYLLQAICSWIISYYADRIRSKKIFSVNVIRKTCNSIGFFGSAACFLGVILAGCDPVLGVIFVTLSMGFNGAIYSGYMVTHVDMSPVFAGTLMGMTNGFANLAGIFAPMLVGTLTDGNQTLHQWQIVFYIAMALFIGTGLCFIVCGSARLQPWDASEPRTSKDYKNGEKLKDSDMDTS